jgi:hypothetical protein
MDRKKNKHRDKRKNAESNSTTTYELYNACNTGDWEDFYAYLPAII